MNKLLIVTLLASGVSFTVHAAQKMTVYKSKYCGCCQAWNQHMQEQGFELDVIETEQLDAVKQQHGIKSEQASCHTALIDGYVIEGHVPARDVQKLLKEKPAIRGLTIPGMPQSAPGMDIPGHPYDVLTLEQDGSHRVWAHYPG